MDNHVTILLPDMFQTFLKDSPVLNPLYEVVKQDSESWITQFCQFPQKMAFKINKCDFSYFCAIAAPYARLQEFTTLCDWGNWVFPFDDMFDNGHLKDQPEKSRYVMDSMMAPMIGKSLEANRLPIVQVHDTILGRLGPSVSSGVFQRYSAAMARYAEGALAHVDDVSAGHLPSLQDMVLIRRQSSGVAPLYHLIEYAHRIQLPDYVFMNPAIQELEVLGMDMVAISNDILSYRKELAEGVTNNMVAVCLSEGSSIQEAINRVGDFLQLRYDAWDETEASLPSWGRVIDAEVQKYIDGIKAVVRANLWWSFKSERYLGPDPDLVRRTRLLDIPLPG